MNSDPARISAARRAVQIGELDKASALAADVLRDTPDHVDAIEIMALVALDRGDYPAAEQALRSAIAIAPARRWPYADLSRLLLKLGRTADAEEVAGHAIAADPDDPDAHAMFGGLLSEREQWREAGKHYERAIELAGDHPHLLAGLGRAQMRQGQLDEAQRTLGRAAKADPSALEPAVYLAEALERAGDLLGAAEQLDRAESIARRHGTDVDLQRSVLLARMGNHAEALSLLEHKPDLSGAALLQRGRLYERVGRYGEAWDDWLAGKAQLAKRANRIYDPRHVRDEAERIAAFFSSTKELPPAPPQDGVPQPVFIIGFPRTGTTLTEQILASHSTIRSGGELPFGGEIYELFRSGVVGRYPDGPERLRDLYLKRAEERGLLGPGARFFTDKMPDNSFWLPLLRSAFPRSSVVLLRRHPLDVLTSVMAHDMTHGFNCGYRLDDAATHHALVDELLERYTAVGLGPTVTLQYEALVADQAGETARLMAVLGLRPEPAQISFHERSAVSPTPSYAQVREPLNDRSIGRWRNFARQLEPVRPILDEAMKRGGYAG